MATTPIFAPDGKLREVPSNEAESALKAGGQKAVRMFDPSGAALRWIPQNKVDEATKAGGRVVEGSPVGTFEKAPPVGSWRWIEGKGWELADVATRTLPAVGGILGGIVGFAGGGPIGAVGGAGVGGMGGEAASQLARRTLGFEAPKTASEAAKKISEQGVIQAGSQALGEVAGQVSRVLHPEFGSRPLAVSPEVEDLLHVHDIHLSAGERSAPGIVSTTEPRAMQTSIAQKPAQEFLRARQLNLQSWADDLAHQISSAPEEGTLIAEQERLGGRLREVGTETGQRISELEKFRRGMIAQTLTGEEKALPSEQGEAILSAVRNQHGAVDEAERQIYEGIRKQAEEQGIKGEWQAAKDFAAKAYQEGVAAEQLGRSKYSPEVMAILRRVAGEGPEAAKVVTDPRMAIVETTAKNLGYKNAQEAINILGKDQFARYFPADIKSVLEEAATTGRKVPITQLMDARTGIGAVKRNLEAQRIESPSIGVLKQLDKLMTRDLESQLGDNLSSQWEQARGLTTEQKQDFNSKFLSSLMKSQNPVAPEKVIHTLMRDGTETDAANLMKVIQHDPEAVAAARRASMDWVLSKGTTAEDALEALRKRPGLRTILGNDQYDQLEKILEGMRSAEIEPANEAYQRFLRRISGADRPSQLVDSAMKSPDDAAQLSRMVGDNSEVRYEVGRDMFRRLLSDSTKAGEFGDAGTHFDPLIFATKFNEAKESLSKFVSPDVMNNLGKFAEALKTLKLSHQIDTSSSVAAAFETLGMLKEATRFSVNQVIGLATLAYLDHPLLSMGAGAGIVAGHMSPLWFTKFALSEAGSRWLSEGATLGERGATSAAVTAWAARFGQIAADLSEHPATSPKDEQDRRKTEENHAAEGSTPGEEKQQQ